MKSLSVALLCVSLLLNGCTSIRSIDMPPAELQAAIRAGELVVPGEQVRLITVDGTEHSFRVVNVDDVAIHGGDTPVVISDVEAVRTRGIDAGRTALLAGGAIGIGFLIAALLAPALILAAAAP